MEEIKIKIASKTYNVKVAQTEDERETGLQNVKELPENSGMLFVFEEPQEVSMWMDETLIPLDIVFIDEEMNVINIHQGVPNSKDMMTENNVCYVLEVNINSGISVGDELEFSGSSQVKKAAMHVLDSNGNSQMELEGGERIMSRANTNVLIKFAKKADVTKNDNDYRALGKRILKFLNIQNGLEPEYVESKK